MGAGQVTIGEMERSTRRAQDRTALIATAPGAPYLAALLGRRFRKLD